MKKNLLYILILLIVAGVAYWFTNQNTDNTMADNPLTSFAITDTASVYKVYIADQDGNNVTLKRGDDGLWMVNDKYRVRKHTFNLILETFAGVGIQSTVPKNQRDMVLRNMAITQRKVMIYDKNDDWIKTWYIGNATKTSQGTYMILETPEDGLSTEPYIVEKRGFRGYLTSRFSTKVDDWRWRGVFYYPDMDIKKVSLVFPKTPEKSFEINVNDLKKNDITLRDYEGNEVAANPMAVQLYLMKYKNLVLESFDPPLLTDAQEDSVAARIPDIRIKVVNNAGEATNLDMQFKPTVANARIADPELPEIDQDRMFALFKGELIQIQRGMFDEILVDPKTLVQK